MTSTFFGIHVALRALTASQRGLDVTNHNIANAQTPGYTRQEVQLTAAPPYTVPSFIGSPEAGQLGTGVEVQRIRRLRDDFLDHQVRQETQALGRWEAMRDGLAQVETIFGEPSGSGLSEMLGRFWNAWHDLSVDPSSAAARANVTQQATSLAVIINRNYSQLEDLRRDLDSRIAGSVDEINSLAQRIAALNIEISKVQGAGDSPNDLRDARDTLLDRLARLVKISYLEMPEGMLQVSVGGIALVAGRNAYTVQAQRDPVTQLLVLQWQDGSPLDIQGGELMGQLELRDSLVPAKMAQMDAMAVALRDAVNNVHRTGYGLDNITGRDFFVGTGAADLAVNPDLLADGSKVGAASQPDAPGDGSKALAVAQLQQQLLMGSATIDDYYRAIISQMGGEAQQARDMADNQGLLVDHLSRSRESVAGVSLDEETANLIKYQHAYQAAARVMTTIDEMLEVLIREMAAR